MISKNHSNRKCYNWLIYDIGDRFLALHAPLYKGVMYDLGAGDAPYKEFFLKHVDKYITVDWSGSYYSTSSDIAADLNKPIPIESEVADTVVSLSVMEHLCEPQTMISEAFRILKTGGTMVLQVPWQWQIHEAPFDYYRYTQYGLSYIFEKAGFVDVKIQAQAGFFTMWLMKINYFTLRLIRGGRFLRWILKSLLRPFWYLNQIAAPYLDKLDKCWPMEASGYFVTARKP